MGRVVKKIQNQREPRIRRRRGLAIESLEGRQMLAADFSDVHVTELHYNPVDDGDLEFLELRNFGATAVDLTGWNFTAGVTLTLDGATLDAGEYGVIVADAAKFTAFYGAGIHILGQITMGGLSNGGEQLAMQTATGQVVFDFTYGDSSTPGWPAEADGVGNSLVVVNPGAGDDLNLAASWRASSAVHGTPGADDNAVIPQLSLALSRAAIVESTGLGAAEGTVSRSGPTNQAVTVTLLSDDLTEVVVPVMVTLGVNQTSATFSIATVDDSILDGSENVTISVSAAGS